MIKFTGTRLVAAAAAVAALLALACGAQETPEAAPAPTAQVIEVIKEVVVEKEVVKEVPKEVVVEKEVVKTVEVERPVEVVKEVVKTVEIEKPVEVIKEVVKTVEVEVPVQSAPVPMVALREEEASGVDIRTEPAYGGTLRLATASDPGSKWDMCEFKNQSYLTYSVENFLFGDYDKGPSGSGDTTYLPVLGFGTDKLATGAMADYWEIPDPLTYSFHLREGLKWQDKHPTYGRAVNVDEMVTELNRIVECRWPRHDFVDSVTGDDTDGDGVNDTITYHTTQPQSFWGYEFAWGPYLIVAPPETLAAEGGTSDPWNQSGTGPWMTVEDGYVAASKIEFEKNPDWWHTYVAPNGREYNLPFMDKVVEIIVPQEANRLAALRTGKIDKLRSVRTADQPAIERSNPDLGKVKPIEGAHIFWMPMNKPPFDNLDVRRAMNMAIDRSHFCDTLFEGDCVPLAFPLTPEWPLHYDTLDTMPASVQEYFEYNPEMAGELLDGAGYPLEGDTRFEIDMMIRNTSELELEAAQIAVGFWDEIGVKVNLDLVDGPVLQSRLFEKQYDFMSNQLVGRPNGLNDFRAGHQWNRSNLNDTEWHALWENVLTSTQADVQIENIKIATRAFLELAPHVQVPAGFGGDYWQPWVQNHNGERVLAFVDYASKWAYVWLDRDMRTDRTGFSE